MEQAIWLIIYIAVFVGIVWGGFWVIGRAKLPQLANWIWGGIILVILIFALVYFAREHGPTGMSHSL